MHDAIAHHLDPDAQPVPEPCSLLPWPSQLPQLYTQYDVIWYQISPWLVRISYPGCVPSQLLVKINSIPAEPRTLWKEVPGCYK